MKGYKYLAKALLRYGVSHLFYQEMMFPNTLREYKSLGGLPIMAHSEFAAGYMADGYARASQKPGVCAAQSAGAANLAASLQDAWLGCTPVVALTGRQIPEKLFRNAYQELDHKYLFESVTKFNSDISVANQMPVVLRHCFRSAVTGKPRPTHIDLYGFCGLEFEEEEIDAEVQVDQCFTSYPPFRPAAENKYILEAIHLINNSERPLIIAGRGSILSGAHEEVLEFARKNQIPIATTCDGKTIIDERDSLWVGISGTYGMSCTNKIAQLADLIIFLGTQANDQATLHWTAPTPLTQVIHIDIDPAEVGRNYPNCLPLVGDVRTIVSQLNREIEKRSREGWAKETAALLKETLVSQEEMWNAGEVPITTARLCDEISKNLPDNAILYADTGWSAIWSSTMLRMKSSQLYLRAAGTLGWSFPASLGGKLAQPDRPVLCYVGDGGMLYFSNEIETAVRYNIPVVTIVNNNYSYAQIVGFLDNCAYKDCHQDCVDRLAFTNGFSLAKIAEDFGALGICVKDPSQIGKAIRQALESGRPAVVEVITDGGNPLSSNS